MPTLKDLSLGPKRTKEIQPTRAKRPTEEPKSKGLSQPQKERLAATPDGKPKKKETQLYERQEEK